MPPRVNFTREEIISASLDVIRMGGGAALTSRNIAKAMGGSTQPIYRIFGTIEDLEKELPEAIRKIANKMMLSGEVNQGHFLSIGMGYLRFCREEPGLFQYAFIEGGRNFALDYRKEPFQGVLEKMRMDRKLDKLPDETLKDLFRDMWIYTHGIASQILIDPGPWDEKTCCEMLLSMGGRLIVHEIMKADGNVNLHEILKEKENENCSP